MSDKESTDPKPVNKGTEVAQNGIIQVGFCVCILERQHAYFYIYSLNFFQYQKLIMLTQILLANQSGGTCTDKPVRNNLVSGLVIPSLPDSFSLCSLFDEKWYVKLVST